MANKTLVEKIAQIIAQHHIPPHVDLHEPYSYLPCGKNEHGVMVYVADKTLIDIHLEQARPVAEAIMLMLKEENR